MANLVYAKPEAATTFKASGGTVVMTLDSVTTGNGRQSAQWDRGATAKPTRYRWQAVFQANAAVAAVGVSIALYIGYGDGTVRDGNLGASDAALTGTAGVRNLLQFGVVQADVVTASVNYVASGEIEIRGQYVVLAMINNLGQTTKTTANVNYITLTPISDEIQ